MQDLLKGKSGKSKAAKKIGESKLHEIEIANSGSNGSAVIVATGANKGYHVRRKSVSVFDEQKGGSSSSSANEKKKPPHKQGAGNSKQPPSILDLSAAFSSHYIQLMKNKVPQRATDVFLGGTEVLVKMRTEVVVLSRTAMMFSISPFSRFDILFFGVVLLCTASTKLPLCNH